MPKCHLQIHIDRANRTYKLGERISGKVDVLPGGDCKCRKITLTPWWTTYGVGEHHVIEAEGPVLPGGEWKNNKKISCAFELPAPPGPLSYSGDLFQVAWHLKAVADLAMAIDAETEERFTLVHGAPSAEPTPWALPIAYNPFDVALSDAPRTSKKKPVHPVIYSALSRLPLLFGVPMLLVIGWSVFARREQIFSGDWGGPVVFALFGLVSLGFIARGFRDAMLRRKRAAQVYLNSLPAEPSKESPRPPGKYWRKPRTLDSSRGWPGLMISLLLSGIGLFLVLVGIVRLATYGASDQNILGIILFVIGAFLILATLRGLGASLEFLRARWKLGRVDVKLMPEALHCGDDLYVSVEFRSPTPVHLNQATAFLEAVEVADYLTKKKRDTETRQIREEGVTLAVDRLLLAQESALLSGKITVPADAPPTFLGGDQKVLWFLSVQLDFTEGLKWSTNIPVLLRP